MYEISSIDHLPAKVDALTQKFDKILVLSHLLLFYLLVKYVVYLAILALIAN